MTTRFPAPPPWLRLMLIGTLWFSLAQVAIKILAKQLPVMEIVTFRGLWGVVLCLWMMRRAGIFSLGTRKRLLLLRGLAGFATMSCSFYSVSVLPLTDAITLYYLHPVFTAVFSAMLGRERFWGRTSAALVVSLLGAIAIARPPLLFGASPVEPHLLGIIAAIVSAVCAGIVLVTLHELGRTEHPLIPTLWVSLSAFTFSLVGTIPDWTMPQGLDWLYIAAIGILTQRAQLDMTKGLALQPAGRASIVGYTQIVFAGLWGAFLFGEMPDWTFYLGASLIVVGSLISSLHGNKPAPVKPTSCTTVPPPSGEDGC